MGESSFKPATDSSARVTLRDGHTMPWLGLGVWETKPAETEKVVKTAVKLGYKAVDTAVLYKNEEGVGAALSGNPDIFVTTKLWNDQQGFDEALRAFDESARKLKRDVIDLYLIHWPMAEQGQYLESWKALIRLRDEGRVKSIGVSNFQQDHLQRIIDETGEVPAINQIELHPYFQQEKLRAFHARYKIQTEAWRPLGKGALLGDATIGRLAQKHHKSPAQIILRWHLQNGLVVIPKSVHEGRMRENIDLFDFELSTADLAEIRALDREDGRMGEDPDNPQFNI